MVAKAVDGRMPADQETIRYTGVYGDDLDGQPYLMREVLGGGSGGRYYADGEDTIHVVPDSRNLPTEFTESRFPFRVEALQLACDSGGPGRYRGGLGYEKHIRMLRDGHFMSIADRSILACWGVRGGLAGQPFSVTIDPGGPEERVVDALADAEPVRAGEVIRIRTTGGGGWGDPLERPYDEVERDVRWGKVSIAGALRDYGVVVTGSEDEPVGRRGGVRRRAGAPDVRAARARSRSSTADRATHASPTAAPRPRSTGSEALSGDGAEPEHVRAGRGEVVVPAATDQRSQPGDGVEVVRRTATASSRAASASSRRDEVRAAGEPSHARPHVGVAAAGAVVAEQGGAQRLVGVGGGGSGDTGHGRQPRLQQLGRTPRRRAAGATPPRPGRAPRRRRRAAPRPARAPRGRPGRG